MSNSLVTDTYKQTKRVARTPRKSPLALSTSALTAGVESEDQSCSPSFEKDLDLLKSFDLNHEFGPCTGITRLERWNRAEKHGLNPPQSVYNVLSQHMNDKEYTQSLWTDYQI